jgi:hypothetical protein
MLNVTREMQIKSTMKIKSQLLECYCQQQTCVFKDVNKENFYIASENAN